MVRHARPHVRKFWAEQNRRSIGLVLVMLGIFYAIGFVFSTLLVQNFVGSVINIFLMWGVLLALAVGLVVGVVASGHISVMGVMNEKEHGRHSRNIGVFMITLAIGAILFALPVTLVPAQASLMVLFSVGGILLLTYTFLNAIFGHSYYEIGFASLALWVAFVVAAFSLANLAYTNPPAFQAMSFVVASISIIIVFAVTGAFMLYHSGIAFHEEFRAAHKIK